MASQKPETKITLDIAKARVVITRAYKAGYAEGINEGQKRLNCMRVSNGYLWKELTRLDEHEPTEGVWISTAFAERLANILKKRHNTYARQLRKQIKNSNQKLDKLLEILEGCKEFK